jgi:hypothetical protein
MRALLFILVFFGSFLSAMPEETDARCSRATIDASYLEPLRELHRFVHGKPRDGHSRRWLEHLTEIPPEGPDLVARVNWAFSMLRADDVQALRHSVGWNCVKLSHRELAAGMLETENVMYAHYRKAKEEFVTIAKKYPILNPSEPMPEFSAKDGLYRVSISSTGLYERARVPLLKQGIVTVGQVAEKTENEVMNIRGIGDSRIEKVRDMLTALGARFKD